MLSAAARAQAPRAPAAAGKFYPADPQELAALVDKHFGAAGDAVPEGRLVAVIAPHAGLAYSGALAAKALAAARGLDPEVVVVVGTGHTKALDGAAIQPGAYATPSVSFAYDAELAKDLLRRGKGAIVSDAGAHKKEHSIEVLLPYLKRAAPNAKLVALVMNTQSLEPAREIGRALAEALEGKRALLVASSDLSHYPPKALAAAVDGATLEAAAGVDPVLFWLANRFLLTRGVKTLAVAWCGEGAVTAVLEASRRLGARSLTVLGRADSADAAYDPTRVVGYAAAALTTAPLKPVERSEAERKELLRLAREALSGWLKTKKLKAADVHPMARLNVPAGAFVTLRDASGKLRGCVGTVKPEAPLHEAVMKAAVGAGVEDARFPPVTASELGALSIQVDVLGPRRAVKPGDLTPRDGVSVERDGKTGVFLPEVWETYKDKEEFLGELCAQKAGLERKCWKDPKTKLAAFAVEAIRP